MCLHPHYGDETQKIVCFCFKCEPALRRAVPAAAAGAFCSRSLIYLHKLFISKTEQKCWDIIAGWAPGPTQWKPFKPFFWSPLSAECQSQRVKEVFCFIPSTAKCCSVLSVNHPAQITWIQSKGVKPPTHRNIKVNRRPVIPMFLIASRCICVASGGAVVWSPTVAFRVKLLNPDQIQAGSQTVLPPEASVQF